MNLHTLDTEITFLKGRLKEYISKLEFEEICRFQSKSANEIIPWKKLKYPGIYLIEVETGDKYDSFEDWSNNFLSRWQHKNYSSAATPNSKKKRKVHYLNKELPEWISLYLGRSMNIRNRIRNHINLGLRKPTTSLKLLDRSNMYNESFRLSSIKIEVKNYDFIAPYVEKKLRDVVNPILGRQ